jgi:hypothetical protein
VFAAKLIVGRAHKRRRPPSVFPSTSSILAGQNDILRSQHSRWWHLQTSIVRTWNHARTNNPVPRCDVRHRSIALNGLICRTSIYPSCSRRPDDTPMTFHIAHLTSERRTLIGLRRCAACVRSGQRLKPARCGGCEVINHTASARPRQPVTVTIGTNRTHHVHDVARVATKARRHPVEFTCASSSGVATVLENHA